MTAELEIGHAARPVEGDGPVEHAQLDDGIALVQPQRQAGELKGAGNVGADHGRCAADAGSLASHQLGQAQASWLKRNALRAVDSGEDNAWKLLLFDQLALAAVQGVVVDWRREVA